MRVCTWNLTLLYDWIHNLNKSSKVRVKLIVDEILDYHERNNEGVDVWMFNEVFIYKKELINGLKERYPHYEYMGGRFPRWFGSGLLIMSKIPFKVEKKEFYKKSYGYDWFTAKGFMSISLNNPNDDKKYYIINTHMQQGDSEKNNSARDEQIDQLINYIKSLKTKRVIFGGDLNMSLNSKYNRNVGYSVLVEKAELDEVKYEKNGWKNYIVRFLTKNISYTFCYKISRRHWDLTDTKRTVLEL